MGGLAVAFLGIAIASLWPDKKWIGWLAMAMACGFIFAWVWLEFRFIAVALFQGHPWKSTVAVFLTGGLLFSAVWLLLVKQSPLPAISQSFSFSTIVPVATVSLGRPIRRIPFDENANDTRIDFYNDLGMLSQRLFRDPPGITFEEKPLGDARVARIFLADLLQYYILHEIRVLQRGTQAFRVTKFLGKGAAVAKAIDVPPVPVPDAFPYPIENPFGALEGNEFLKVYSYSTSVKDGLETPHWEQIERTYWQSREHPFEVPRGTIISFSGNNNDPERDVLLERPGFYKLKFAAVPLFGGNGSLPENFYTSQPGVDSYSCRITMDYEIRQRSDGGFAPSLYTQWAESLFSGMKRVMAP
ncbi:MAG: hypothetical protein WAN23_17005 [Candidatus Acidiferrales bacterium]